MLSVLACFFGCVIGWIFGTFSLGNILLSLGFSIPFISRTSKLGYVTNKTKLYCSVFYTIAVQSAISFVLLFLCYKYVSICFSGYVFGYIFSGLLVLDKKNDLVNMTDFLKLNYDCFDLELFEIQLITSDLINAENKPTNVPELLHKLEEYQKHSNAALEKIIDTEEHKSDKTNKLMDIVNFMLIISIPIAIFYILAKL